MKDHHDESDPTRTHLVLTNGQAVNQYRILDRIGSGGMGTVYLAEDTALRRQVALKFMPSNRVNDTAYRTRFVREAQAAAALNHPNVVHIYEVAEFQGQPFFAMEHVDGRPLKEYIADASMTLTEALEMAGAICDGLQRAHEHGIVHRDIKPQNIVVDRDGRPKILDFGLAAVQGADKLTRDGTTVGTVAYMSPEQVAGKAVDARSDIFSLGVVLYELLTGHNPFRQETEAATLSAVLHNDPEPLARFRRTLPESLQQIIDRALDKDPTTRYQSVAGMRADLIRERRALESGVSMSRSTKAGAAPRSNLKRFMVSSAFAVVIVVLILVLKPWQFEIRSSNDAQASENRLAVMYFDNLIEPEDPKRLGEIVTNLLITDLSESSQVRVLSSQRLYDILSELGKASDRTISRDLATRVAERSQARWMLTGTILQTEPNLVLTAQVIEVASGQVAFSERITGDIDEDVFAQTDRLAGSIREAMHLEAISGDGSHELESITTRSPEAYRLYLEGVEAHRQLFADRAREKIRAAIAIDSTFAEAYFYMATSLANYPENKRYIELAIANSDHASPLLRKKTRAAAEGIDGRSEDALATLREIVRQYPDDVDSYVGIASILLDLDRRPEAIEVYEKILTIDPRDRHALNQLAYMHKRERNLDEALTWAERYIEVTPYEPNPYDTKAEILADMGRMDEALALFERAYATDTLFVGGFLHLFWIHMYLGNFDQAEALSDRIHAYSRRMPIVRRAQLETATALLELTGRYGAALEYLDGQISRYRNHPEDRRMAAEALTFKEYILGRMERYGDLPVIADELETFQELEETWTGMTALYTRAQHFARQGETEAALRLVDSVAAMTIDGRPNSGSASHLRLKGWVLHLLGRSLEAIPPLETSLAIRGDFWYGNAIPLVRAYLAVDRAADAVALLEPYTSSMPEVGYCDVAYIHCWLGKAKEQLQRNAEAREHYRLALERWRMADGSDPMYHFAKERFAALSAGLQ